MSRTFCLDLGMALNLLPQTTLTCAEESNFGVLISLLRKPEPLCLPRGCVLSDVRAWLLLWAALFLLPDAAGLWTWSQQPLLHFVGSLSPQGLILM